MVSTRILFLRWINFCTVLNLLVEFSMCNCKEILDVESSVNQEKLKLQKRAKKTYAALLPCIQNNSLIAEKSPMESWTFPDDADEHYADLLKKTEKYRNLASHVVFGYQGPWIENAWIQHFENFPLSRFNGLIPIFVQFVDIHANCFSGRQNRGKFIEMFESLGTELAALLRPNVLYLAVSQDDEGITNRNTSRSLFHLRPNILTMSAGGYGHIPIPLVKGTLKYTPPPRAFQWQVGFYGASDTSDARARILKVVQREIAASGLSNHFPEVQRQSNDWIHKMETTLFNLAPRGFGRTSYRLAEIIQMGRLPVYLGSDVAWTPYDGTDIGIAELGLVATEQELYSLTTKIKNISNEGAIEKLNRVRVARVHYTLPGIISQIERFLKDPLGPNGGELRCMRVPDSTV